MTNEPHSLLAPSSKEWFYCGYAVRFLATKEEESNEQSEFGSECHALGEAYVRLRLNVVDYDSEPIDIEALKQSFKHYNEEMENLASAYADFIVNLMTLEEKRTGDKPLLFLEHTLDCSYAENTHGTADAIMVTNKEIVIIDNKTGFIEQNVVDGEELNSQLGIYGLYALKAFEDVYNISTVRLIIFQERLHHISETVLSKDQLINWEITRLLPAAEEALNPHAEPHPGSHCKYCPGRVWCRKRSEEALSEVGDMKEVSLMSEAEIEELLPRLEFIQDYCESIKAFALKKAVENGKKWKGYVLGHGVSKRKFSDESKVAKILTEAGFEVYQKDKLKSLSELEKLVGKARFKELVGIYIIKPEGAPVLVKETIKEGE